MKILLIFSTYYANEIQRSATLSDVDILAKYVGIEDIQNNMALAKQADFIVSSDLLYAGHTPSDMISFLESNGCLDKLFFVLRDNRYVDLIMDKGVPYVFENTTSPMDLIDRLQQMSDKRRFQVEDAPKKEPTPTEKNEQESKRMMDAFDHSRIAKQQKKEPIENRQGKSIPSGSGVSVNLKPITVCFNSPKGGVGKTTLAIEIASLIAARASELDLNRAGKLSYNKSVQVCLVDMNPSFDTMAATLDSINNMEHFQTVSDWFSIIEKKIIASLDPATRSKLLKEQFANVEDYLDEKKIFFTREEVFNLLIKDEETGLYILPSISLPTDAMYANSSYIKLILDTLKAIFDVVIIDSGNNISYFTVEAMKESNEILLVCAKTKACAATVAKLMKTVGELNVSPSKFSLVINNPNNSGNVYSAETFEKILKMPLAADIPFDQKLQDAHEEGVPYAIHHKKSEFARACTKLAHSICPLWSAVPSGKRKKKKKGFFARMKGGR